MAARQLTLQNIRKQANRRVKALPFMRNQYRNFNRAMLTAEGNDSRTFHIYDMAHKYLGDVSISVSLTGEDLLSRIAELNDELRQNRFNLGVGWINSNDSYALLNCNATLIDQNLADDLTVIINLAYWHVSNNNAAVASGPPPPAPLLTRQNGVAGLHFGGRRKKTHRKRKNLKRKTHRKH